MSPLNLAARLIATLAHEVVSEYRKLAVPGEVTETPPPDISCTQATTERAWSPVAEVPASAFGFRRQQS